MKKILLAVALIATLGSCQSEPELYFAEIQNKTSNNPEAEFDTLSYALGMNYALYFQLKAPELQYDNELMAETYIETFEKGIKSFSELEAAQKEFGKYQKSHMTEYQNAMRIRMLTRNNSAPLPNIYDEEFTSTMFTEMASRVNAYTLMTQNTPLNVHYIAQGIRDAKMVEADSLIDSTMKISTKDMVMHLQRFQRGELMKNIKAQADVWMADIATRPEIQTLVVNGDTIYYRINNPGSEIKPESKDSIALNYALYSFRGRLVESTDSRISTIEETIELIKSDKEITDSARNERIKMANEQLVKAKSQMMVLDQLRIRAMKECLPLIGEQGSITIWAPGKYAPRTQLLVAGEPVVINVELNKIIKGANKAATPTPVTPKMVPGRNLPGKASMKPQGEEGDRVVRPVPLTTTPKTPKK